MQVLKPRLRTVSFRVSQEEYDCLRKLSLSKGARSVSDFTRSVACRMDPDDSSPDSAARLANLVLTLSEIATKLDQDIQCLMGFPETQEKKSV